MCHCNTYSYVSFALTLIAGVLDFVLFPGKFRFRPQSPRDSEDAGVAMAWYVGWAVVAVSEWRYRPEVSSGWTGSGRGSEKRRDDWSNRAVGEVAVLDMVVYGG